MPPLQRPDPLGHRSGHHHPLQRHHGPRRAGELDGPDEVHLVLLDNGRSQAYRDEELRKTFAVHPLRRLHEPLPVYTRIGGHAYGTIYPAPSAKSSPHLLGLESTSDLVTASSLCGACGEVCPVRIPIPICCSACAGRLARRTARSRTAGGAGGGQKPARDPRHAGALPLPPPTRASTTPQPGVAGRLRGLMPKHLGPWTQCREAPQPAPRACNALLRQKKKES